MQRQHTRTRTRLTLHTRSLPSSSPPSRYNHIPGDGREFVVCDPNAVKIRAEDGRSVSNVDITPFIDNLPFGKQTTSFCTPDASGSTSQATNIMESLEVGATTLMVDEDTCATNFMIRDERMQALVSPDKEPIKPFISRIRDLYEINGVSTVLVVGGSGDYFAVADKVLMMDSYAPVDVTERAKEIAHSAAEAKQGDAGEGGGVLGSAVAVAADQVRRGVRVVPRDPRPESFATNGKTMARRIDIVQWGDEEIDLTCVEQLVEVSQTRAIVEVMKTLGRRPVGEPAVGGGGGGGGGDGGGRTLKGVLAELNRMMDEGGIDAVCSDWTVGNLARPRTFELAAGINRLRALVCAQQAPLDQHN